MIPLDRKTYCTLVERVTHNIFASPRWLDIVCNRNWSAYGIKDQSGQIIAAIPLFTGQKYGFVSWARMPPLTPYLAMTFMLEGTDPSAAFSLPSADALTHLTQLLQPRHYTNVLLDPHLSRLPIGNTTLKTSREVTYKILDIQSPDLVFANFKSSGRNKVRKAEKVLEIVPSTDLGCLMELADKTFGKQNLPNPYRVKMLEEILKLENCRLWAAQEANGTTHAMHLLVWDDDTAYNLITASNPDLHQSGAVSFLLWHSIQFASSWAKSYDFEGGQIASIAKFYRSFGAEPISYLRLYGSGSTLLKNLFKLSGKFDY